MNLNIVAISGSLRRESYNTAVMNTLPELAPGGMTITGITVEEIPPFNQDLRDSGSWPEAVERLSNKVLSADGVVFVTPEYNYSVPGVLKNAIDWLSRREPQPFKAKPITIMGASTGMMGTARAQYHLRQILVFVEAIAMPKPETFIANAREKVKDGRLVDTPTREHITRQLNAFAKWIERVSEPT